MAALALRNSDASAFLVVCMGPNVGHRYPLFDRTLMGRSDSADITLADDRVSGKHCEVLRAANGFVVRDLGSSNGTLVNAQKISEVDLREGDVVQVGYTVFKFQSVAGSRVERVNDPQVLVPGMGGLPMGAMPMSMSGMPGMPMGMQGMPMGMQGMPMGMQGMQMPMGVPMQAPPATAAPDQEMNLEEMVGNVRKFAEFFLPHAKLIAATALVGLLLGVALALTSPPGAKATFEMNILTGADRGQGGAATDRAQAAKSNFKSTVLLERTLKTLGEEGDEERIAALQRMLTFESTTPNFGMPPPVQNFIGEFQASSPEFAMTFLDTHLKTFIDSEVEKTTKVISSKLEYLTEQIAKAEATLKATDEDLRKFKLEFLDSLPENVAKLQEQIFELEKAKTDLTSGIEQLKQEIASASASGGGASRKQREMKAVQEQIAELKAQGLGDNHPDVVSIKKRLERIAAAPEEMGGSGRSGDKSIGQLKAEMSAKTLSLDETVRKLEELKKQQEKLPEFTARYTDLTRSYDSSKKLYDQLFQDKNQAEYQLGFERTSAQGRFEVVVPPRVEKASPVKAYGKKVAMGLGGGLALGIGLALFLQILKIWKRAR
jgi:predicted  nucleic acid-binding Zn-ribbon protein